MRKKTYLILVSLFVVLFVCGSIIYHCGKKSFTSKKNNPTANITKPVPIEEDDDKPNEENKINNNEKSTSSNSEIQYMAYNIKSGDTLYTIAKNTMPKITPTKGVKILMELNKTDEHIKAGDKILIPIKY